MPTNKTQRPPNNRSIFYKLLANSLVANVTNMTVWFAVTYFVYLETRSVMATAIVAGIYTIAVAASGFWFGSLVDHNKKKPLMQGANLVSLFIYAAAFIFYGLVPNDTFKDPSSPLLWMFVILLLAGAIVSNIRSIALPTIVTALFEESQRDKANGLVGTAWGIAFMLVSIISGLLVGLGGMPWVLTFALITLTLTILHLATIPVPEKKAAIKTNGKHVTRKVDIRGTLLIIGAIPGLFALIFFTTFNNFLGGVFMSLMDAYGLSLVTVQVWGFIWGALSLGFIVGGMIIAKWGLGKKPLRSLFIANIIIWAICCVFTLHASIILLIVGMFVYLSVVPFIEAAEHTILQKVVPYERQGRVFGFAQSVEMAASPLTAFLIGPLTQLFFIPFMSDGGSGAQLIGDWFGTGPARGIALVFTVTGFIGLLTTLIAMSTKHYRLLSREYARK